MNGYLIYHPKRQASTIGDLTVYHDATIANQDPYVWNTCFLHTYCHMSQLSPVVGQLIFWVSGDSFPNFSRLSCDLVFVTERKCQWQKANSIDRDDPIVDSEESFVDHYQWAFQHNFKRRGRFTLKAHPLQSFQPQNSDKTLIDIVPFLTGIDLPLEALHKGLRAGYNSKPFLLGEVASMLYDWLAQNASIKVIGTELEEIRRRNPQLASGSKMGYLRNASRRRTRAAQ